MPFQIVKRIAIIRCRSWFVVIVAVFSLLMAITVSSFSKSMTTPISPSTRDDNKYSKVNTKAKQKPYRKGIMAVFTDSQRERVLVCKRKRSNKSKTKAEWQFPQGGIETKMNELPKEALYREVSEELGNNQFRIVKQSKELVRYDFPSGRNFKPMYRGQEHAWFLCEYTADMGPELHRAVDDDFEECEWVYPQQALERVASWKRQAYILGLQQLGMLS